MNSWDDPEQLKILCDSQFKTIVEQSKKIQDLEKEVSTLKTSSLQLVDKPRDIIKLDVDHQEIICKVQLALLEEQSFKRELTLEEARKLEIYTKILTNIQNSRKQKNGGLKEVSDEDLIKELSDGTEG